MKKKLSIVNNFFRDLFYWGLYRILASLLLDDITGFIFSLVGLTIAGAEVSLGLALTIVVYRKFDSIYSKKLEYLKS